MLKRLQPPWFFAALAILLPSAAALLLVPGIGGNLFSTGNFMPHAHCYLQNTKLIWLHVVTDSAIALAYFAISSTLAFLVFRARRDIPFHWMFLSFGLFIVSCGFTHVLEVWTVWTPVYWLSGDVKLVTAVASMATAVALPPLLPKVFQLIHSAKLSEERKAQLEAANAELKELYSRVTQLDEAKSKFFANVSHELRTPLALISGPAHKLAESPRLDASQQRDAEMIERNAALLLRHVNDLLDTARAEAGRMELEYQNVDLGHLIRLTAAHFDSAANEREVTFEVEAPPSVPAQVDGEKLQRVLINLLSNAFKFVPEGGRIACRLRVREGRGLIDIQDNGPGVPEGSREAVFERFRQADTGSARRFGGTGLGLSIVRDFVELHRGAVTVEEAPGGGALFRIDVPLRAPDGTPVSDAPAPTFQPMAPAPKRPALKVQITGTDAEGETDRARLLLVEDNAEMNEFITGILSEQHVIVRAYNGRQGLEAALEQRPDLVLSDIMMPELNGHELLRELRQRDHLRHVPVILLSAKADEETRVALLREGAHDYLIKPFSIEELKARVENALSIHRARLLLQNEVQSQNQDLVALADETLRRKRQVEEALESQRRAEEALRTLNDELEARVRERTAQLEASHKEMESFSYSVSHDLRAPVRAVQGMAQALAEDCADRLNPEGLEYLQRISSAATRMEELIQDLLEYSHVSRGDIKLTSVNLKLAVNETLEQLSAEVAGRNADLSVDLDDVAVHANATLLRQATANLISNALKFTAPGVVPRVRVRTEIRGPIVRLTVEDNGIGIEPHHQRKIFDVFERLHGAEAYAGTGIGLAIVARAVEKMEGKFGVASTPGQGSSFWFELSVSDAPA